MLNSNNYKCIEFSVTNFYQFSNRKLKIGHAFYVHFLKMKLRIEKKQKKTVVTGML